MATHRHHESGCASVCALSPQLNKAVSLSSSLAYMQLFLLLLSAALVRSTVVLSLAHSHSSEPSSLNSEAASSQIDRLHGQEEPSTANKPFIYETAAASANQAGSAFLMHASFPHKERLNIGLDPKRRPALLVDDAQDHASKEEPPLVTTAFTIAALFNSSLAPGAEDTHLHNNPMLQDADATLLDNGNRHVPEPSFIHESVVASLPRKAHGSTQILHESVPQVENTFRRDDGMGKLLLVRKKTVTELIHLKVNDAIRDNVPQEKKAFLLDDGGKHIVDNVKKNPKPMNASKPCIHHKSVVAQFHKEFHAAGGCSRCDNVSNDTSSLIHDDVQGVLKKLEEPIRVKLSFRNKRMATSSRHLGRQSPRGNLAQQDNGPQPENVLPLDYNGRLHAQESPDADVASVQEGKLLQGNVPQKKHDFLLGGGRKKRISSTHHDGNSKNLLVDTGHKKVKSQSLHNIDDNKMSLSVQVSKLLATVAASHLHDNVPQGTNAFLVSDGGIEHSEENSHLLSLKEVEVLLHDNVPQEKHGSAKHIRPFQFVKKEEHVLHDASVQRQYSSLVILANDDDERKTPHRNNHLHKDWPGDNIKNHKRPPIYQKLCRLGKCSLNDEKLRMVVSDSSKNMEIKKGQWVSIRANDDNCNEENLRTAIENSSVKMIHEEHPMTNTKIGDPEKETLRMVVGDASENLVPKGSLEWHIETRRPNMPNLIMAVGRNSTRTYQGFEAEDYPAKENLLKMVVGDESSKNNTKSGFKVQGNPSSVENLRMVVDDASNNTLQEGYDNPPKDNNLRMTVDDIPNILISKKPFRTRGRSRSCTSNPDVCNRLGHTEHIQHIALYGQPIPQKRLACCGGVCVDLNNNHLHCGSCGKACGLSQPTCCNGKCTDLNKDNSNCGQCGHSCLSFSPCQYGMCGYY